VWAADSGRDTNREAVAEFSGTVLSAAARLTRRQSEERSRAAVADAIADGKVPWRGATPGYRRVDGRLQVHERDAAIVRQAFELRAAGTTVKDVRTFLAAHGIERTFHGVVTLLSSRVVLGEINFGKYTPNLQAHEPIVDLDLFNAVQRVKVPRGRRAKSERLLARLGVLRCESCGARMVINSRPQGDRYRCPQVGDCTAKTAISAELVEGIVWDAVKAATANVEGRASIEEHARDAEHEAARAQEEYDALIDLLDPATGHANSSSNSSASAGRS
jgi:hypothetical protein